VWTVFLAFLAAILGAIGLQVIVVIPLAIWLVSQGTDPKRLGDELTSMLTTPAGFMLLALLGQAPIIPARLSPEPTLLRLRFVKPAMPSWAYPVFAVASLLPLALGLLFAYSLERVVTPDPTAARLYQQMTWQFAIPFVLFIALVPAFTEESLFRGYIQSRLLQRWPTWVAILVTAVLFSLSHVTPHAVVAVVPLAFWLGILAWRTGSVWPGIVCHAFVNGSWNTWQTGHRLAGFDELPLMPALIRVGVVALVCFMLPCWLLVRPSQAPWEAEELAFGGSQGGDESPP
jgi:membrane protease YdiL (CAAX protease family)